MKFEALVKLISEDFTVAWNQWDIEKLLTFVANSVVVRSPKVGMIYPENAACEIVGKEALHEYWTKLKIKNGKFDVTQLSITCDGRKLETVNKLNGQDILIYETILLDEYGKIIFLNYEYRNS
ncbi:MAG: nuclear transport factor 2 family protein [Bacteroidetes bacterium]|nr:nuclear transport factor 2 family protein [Bacteroidota bacterium]MBK8145868.1 nuclear transport factor 2 family protein [Bacteroidota bacterium]MBP6314917.1 nuclear transport factor 2 family protein [Chitinophagaceae bacterium]